MFVLFSNASNLALFLVTNFLEEFPTLKKVTDHDKSPNFPIDKYTF